jgi:hypothetical protein
MRDLQDSRLNFLNGAQRRRATEDFRPALHCHGILKMHHVNNGAALITNIDMVTQVDAPGLGDAGLDHRAGLAQSMRQSCVSVGKLHAFVVADIHVVMEIEKVAGHGAITRAPPVRCQC